MTNGTNTKLSPHLTWLFAFGSILVGLGASYLLRGMGGKAAAGAYAAVIVVAGFLSTFLTRAKTGGAILSFLVASGAAAAGYYLFIAKLFSVAAETIPAGGSASDIAAQHAVQSAGNTLGAFIAVVVFVATFIPSIIGAAAGAGARGKTGTAAAGSLAKLAA